MRTPLPSLALLTAVAWLTGPPARAAAPSFQDLMSPDVFPAPQSGMVVEAASLGSDAWQVTTTGAHIQASLERGELRFQQRIGHRRPVLRLRLGTALRGPRMTHDGPGLARATFTDPPLTIRVNGDSLLMLHTRRPLTVTLDRLILPAWFASYRNNHLVVDEWGGFGLYCSETALDDQFDPYGNPIAVYRLPAGAVLCVGVCPPKPYPWERSLRDNVVWHHSRDLAYPPDDVLKAWRPHGNTVLLQSEIMLWKDWNLDFVPRLGPEEFARVRRTTHDLGMRFIVYASPYYFIKGTPLERYAINTYDQFQGYPPGRSTGENIDLFMAATERLMKEHQPDGLYFDGQYMTNPAALYALARRTRALLGDDGILEWHSTTALGPGHCYMPHADAYVDFILKGEGDAKLYASPDYLRFFVSGYNVNNSIGVICNNDGTLNADLCRQLLQVNARLHTITAWLDHPHMMEVLQRHYQPCLTADLRRAVEAAAARRQREVPARAAAYRAQVAQRAASYAAEAAALRAAPAWSHPLLSLTFGAMPDAAQRVSAQNLDPFSISNGTLNIRARANTHAFFSYPVEGEVRGLVLKVRHGSDRGMSWGPAAALRFASGALLRIGTRADGRLQADLTGRQLPGAQWLPKIPARNLLLSFDVRNEQLLARAYDPQRWVWLRARWTDHWGAIERSDDGAHYRTVWRFEHDASLAGDAADLLVGKVPYNAQPHDYADDSGPVGECEIGLVQVYR